MPKFQAVKGTRDFYPDQMAFRNWLFAKMRKVAGRFGYEEYDGPVVEPLALYAAKSGEELVKEQTFILKDRSGEDLALRPEMTPTLARMVAKKQGQLIFPLRWFNIGPRFRYEQPQKGRTREFYQWDVDLIGPQSPEADAEVITVAATLLKEIGLTSNEVKIKVNNRKFMEQKLNLIQIPKELLSAVFRAIDRQEKIEEKAWEEYLSGIGLSDLQIKDLKGILEDRDFAEESEELTRLFSTLSDLDIADFVEFDPTIVRGLDYYTGTVFEARDTAGKLRSLCGGGRYDNLVEVVGGQPVSGVGFAASDVVSEMALKEFGKIPPVFSNQTRILVTVFDESLYRNSLQACQFLRQKDINTQITVSQNSQIPSLDKQLKYADQKGIPFVLIIGPEEASQNKVTVKNMSDQKQTQVKLEEIESVI